MYKYSKWTIRLIILRRKETAIYRSTKFFGERDSGIKNMIVYYYTPS